MDEDDDSCKNDDDTGKCLITSDKLTDKFVKLECGHSFNYIPLFNDIKNHKSNFNSMEGQNTMLKQNEIRCPYCRKRQIGVLPYYEDLQFDKILGVNYCDNNSNKNFGCFFTQKGCDYIYKIKFSHTNPTFKDYGCPQKYVYNCEDGKQYCFHHHSIIKKILVKQQTQKLKEDAKQAKIEIQNKAKDEKMKALVKAKEEKMKDKKIKKKKEENFIIEPLEQQYCCSILKSGIEKGNQCSKNIYLENLCKRHYNIKFKETE